MMDFDIRKIILKNLAGSSREEVEGYINETIENREEDALPGMGILFEEVWKQSDASARNSMMEKIMNTINAQTGNK